MFKNLFNFAYQRNWKEAIGFYVFYILSMHFFLFLIYILLYTAFKFGIISSAKKYLEIIDVYILFIDIFTFFIFALISLLIFSKKNLRDPLSIITISFGSSILLFWGDISGFVALAILSMIPNKNISK